MPSYSIATSIVSNTTTGRTLARAPDGRLWTCYLKLVNSYRQVFAAYSDNGGQTWTEEQVTSVSGNQGFPTLAVNSLGEVILVWAGLGWGTNTGYENIQYRKRTSAGWQAREAVTDKANTQTCPSIALDSADNVHVVWSGYGWGTNTGYYNIQYRKRTSAGWQVQEAVTDVAVNQALALGTYYGLVLALDSADNVHLAWTGTGWGTNTGYKNIQYRKRTTAWQTQESVTDKNADQVFPSIALDSADNVHLAWTGLGWGTNTGYKNIQYRKRTTAWQTQEAITDEDSNQLNPSIALDLSDNVHVAWHGQGWGTNTTVNNIQYRKRTATAWETQVGLTDSATAQVYPRLLWARWPVVSGAKTNVPVAGYEFTWENGTTHSIYLSADLSWVVTVTKTVTLLRDRSGVVTKTVTLLRDRPGVVTKAVTLKRGRFGAYYFLDPPTWQRNTGPRRTRVYVLIEAGAVYTAAQAGVTSHVDAPMLKVPATTTAAEAQNVANAALAAAQVDQGPRIQGATDLSVLIGFGRKVDCAWNERSHAGAVETVATRESVTVRVNSIVHDVDTMTTTFELGDEVPGDLQAIADALVAARQG